MDEFDHHTEEFARHWPEIYADLRERSPIVHTDAHGGYYAVTKYSDVRQILHDPTTFSSSREIETDHGTVGGATIPITASRLGMMEMDPPQSLKYRKIISPFFSARAIGQHADRITEIIDWVIDQSIEAGEFDVVNDLAVKIPPVIIVELLGLPLERWSHYSEALHLGISHAKGSGRAIGQMMREVYEIASSWRLDGPPPETVCAALVEADVDGAPIEDALVGELVFMLLTGGVDTTQAQIGNVLLTLSRRPELRRHLIEHPEDIPNAVDEMLRLFTPGTIAARTVVQETEVGGSTFTRGDRIFLAVGSANRDEEMFPEPDELRLDRKNVSQHAAFGLGIHRCIGAHLARLELITVVQRVLLRLPDFVIDPASVVPSPKIPLVNGHLNLRASFTPGPKVLIDYREDVPLPV